jgi:hypothetical protein
MRPCPSCRDRLPRLEGNSGGLAQRERNLGNLPVKLSARLGAGDVRGAVPCIPSPLPRLSARAESRLEIRQVRLSGGAIGGA